MTPVRQTPIIPSSAGINGAVHSRAAPVSSEEPNMTTQTPVTADEVSKLILEVLNSSDVDEPTALIALFDAMLSVLASIRCPDCRETAADSARKLFPDMIAEALKAPRDHVH
jgi:hypothetical protein